MPYCPKCDMEFVEGITICTDCGGPLVESEDAYKAEQQRQREEALERRRLEAQREFTIEELFPEEDGACDRFETDDDRAGAPEDGGRREDGRSEARTAEKHASSGIYVTTRQRCEDMQSSASAFLLVGGAITIAAALCWAGIIRLPMSDGSRMFFQAVLTAMGVASLIVSFKTRSSVSSLRKKAEEEERCTADLIQWFTESFTGPLLDQELLKEDPSLTGPELELKRFELIQDYLITGQDLPNQPYVEYLSEEIYGKIFG